MTTVAVIQARLQSTRLPAKVLREIAGTSMLKRVVQRTQLASEVNEVVIAVPDGDSDQVLRDYIASEGWPMVTGSEQDVLARYVTAAKVTGASRVVRITSDCPLIDPQLIDDVLRVQQQQAVDYACNFFPLRYFPRGLDCEVLTTEALMRLDQLAQLPRHREHVTLMVYDSSDDQLFTQASTVAPRDWSDLRWTVDTREDLMLARLIYDHFGEQHFGWQDVLDAYPRHPAWNSINHQTLQKVA